MGGSFWPKDSLITYIGFELYIIWYISQVANFGTHTLSFWGFILVLEYFKTSENRTLDATPVQRKGIIIWDALILTNWIGRLLE